MTSILLFLAGALVATIILMTVGQKKNRELSDRISTLASDISAKQKEAEMLSKQLNDSKSEHERRMNEAKQQFETQLEEADRRHKRDSEERTAMLDKQFAERLKLMQEQLNTTTERLLKQRSEELGNTNRNQIDSILAPMRAVMAEMKKSMDDNRESFTRSTASLSEQLRQMHATTTSLGAEAESCRKRCRRDLRYRATSAK